MRPHGPKPFLLNVFSDCWTTAHVLLHFLIANPVTNVSFNSFDVVLLHLCHVCLQWQREWIQCSLLCGSVLSKSDGERNLRPKAAWFTIHHFKRFCCWSSLIYRIKFSHHIQYVVLLKGQALSGLLKKGVHCVVRLFASPSQYAFILFFILQKRQDYFQTELILVEEAG